MPDEKRKIRAYPLAHQANDGKVAQVRALFSPWRESCAGMQRQLIRRMQDGKTLNPRMSTKTSDLSFKSDLSARQIKSVYNQVYANLSSWQGLLKIAVRETISGSTVDDETKTILYRANQYKAWYFRSLSLPMSINTATGEVRHGKLTGKDWVTGEPLEVPASLLKLLRHIAKHAARSCPLPDLSRVNSMSMDGTIAQIEAPEKEGSIDYWVRVSTLNKGKPVRVPLTANKYFNKAPGTLSDFVQVNVKADGSIQFVLQKKSEVSEPRPDNGNWLGLDWGLTFLFATSDGRLFGQGALPHLRELDRQATELSRALQRQGHAPRKNKRYQALQRRIREYIKNEVNRILNKLAREDLAGLVVENLDFRGGGMGKQMNRLITRFGRKAIKTKLQSLTEDHGINVVEVNAAYTSQQCSGCGYVHTTNRSKKQRLKFSCRFCGKKVHADINGARIIDSRRSWVTQDGSKTKSMRGTLRQRLDGEFAARWGCAPPAAGATGHPEPDAQRRFAVRLVTAT